jgi:hypothetical protein
MKLNTDYEAGLELARKFKTTQSLVNGALSMFIWCSFALTVSTILWQWL